jgi:hypothetical protein
LCFHKVDKLECPFFHNPVLIPAETQHCCGLGLPERRLVASRSTVIIPFDDRVIFISSLYCAQFSGRLSEVPQAFHPVSRNQFFAGGSGLGERWFLGAV